LLVYEVAISPVCSSCTTTAACWKTTHEFENVLFLAEVKNVLFVLSTEGNNHQQLTGENQTKKT